MFKFEAENMSVSCSQNCEWLEELQKKERDANAALARKMLKRLHSRITYWEPACDPIKVAKAKEQLAYFRDAITMYEEQSCTGLALCDGIDEINAAIIYMLGHICGGK